MSDIPRRLFLESMAAAMAALPPVGRAQASVPSAQVFPPRPTAKITDLCSKLIAIGLEHGDIEVFVEADDPDGIPREWEPSVELSPSREAPEWGIPRPKCVLIKVD